jgi:hypothetical protein
MINRFQSDLDLEVFGFTRDTTGRNLPEKFAPWRKSSQAASLYLGAGESSAQLGSGDPAIRAVQTHGYYVVGIQSKCPTDRWRRHWRHGG